MQEASAETVLGDFDDVTFEHLGVTSRFFRRGESFYVNTEGPDGEPADFEITYTFGVEPLQQYLIEFPGGRYQCLTIAWDTTAKRWFHLYPDERIPAGDELHWTGRYQRWNAMCAECHSTELRKNYDLETDTYATTWHEIDVGCQACHGPGAAHLAWARGEGGDEETLGLTGRLKRGEQAGQLDACSPCHSRRTALHDDYVHGDPFHDSYLPQNIQAGLYHADGQILDEVYVWGSFAQSKMHERGVACSDCHDPHSLQLLEQDDGLCLQCHTELAPLDRFPTLKAADYTTREHHHHEPGSEGARCVNCHMPTRTYMVVDPRRDHSFRVPRPDLTVELGVPNACNQCHTDETAEWAAAAVDEWTGGAEPAAHFGRAFAAAQAGDPAALVALAEVAIDPDQPSVVRTSALDLLRAYGAAGVSVAQGALQDEDPRVRAAAVRGLEAMPAAQRLAAITMLEDGSLAVRVEAALSMAGAPIEQLGPEWGAIFERAENEFIAAQNANADLPSSHLNLAVLHDRRGRLDEAEREYRIALSHDRAFLPARFNLATLLNRMRRNTEAEALLRAGIELVPEEGELHYSLGLLLAEMGRAKESAESLMRAASRLPEQARVHYNTGLALQSLERLAEAETFLLSSEQIDPADPDTQHALVLLYARQGERSRALAHTKKLATAIPDAPPPAELLQRILEQAGIENAFE
jgi:predicted CXXCH cytochrome family protein